MVGLVRCCNLELPQKIPWFHIHRVEQKYDSWRSFVQWSCINKSTNPRPLVLPFKIGRSYTTIFIYSRVPRYLSRRRRIKTMEYRLPNRKTHVGHNTHLIKTRLCHRIIKRGGGDMDNLVARIIKVRQLREQGTIVDNEPERTPCPQQGWTSISECCPSESSSYNMFLASPCTGWTSASWTYVLLTSKQ